MNYIIFYYIELHYIYKVYYDELHVISNYVELRRENFDVYIKNDRMSQKIIDFKIFTKSLTFMAYIGGNG